jgi:hypothetical protein
MGTFKYCSSYDELEWEIGPYEGVNRMKLTKDELLYIKHDIRSWIERSCFGEVFVWNGVEAPTHGEHDWGKKVVPQGNATIYFKDERDFSFFQLKWRSRG